MKKRRLPGEGSVRHRDDGRWEARVSVGGRSNRRTLSAYASTRDDALDALSRLRRRAGVYTPSDPEHQTVGQYLDWWVDVELAGQVAEGALAATTAEAYERRVRLQLKPHLGHHRLVKLGPQHIRTMLRALAGDGLAAGTRGQVLAALSSALTVAWRDLEIIDSNPTAKVAAPKIRRARPPVLPLDDAKAILRAVQHPAHRRLDALWTSAMLVGLRPGEALGLCWDQVDFDDRTLTVSRNLVRVAGGWRMHDTKGHTTRYVPLPRFAADTLRAHRKAQLDERMHAGGLWRPDRVVDLDGVDRGGQLVFTTQTGRPINRQWVGVELGRICEAAGVQRLTPHQYMRHGGATIMLALGVDLMTIRDVLGHYSISMSEIYAHVVDETMRAAADTIDAAFGER